MCSPELRWNLQAWQGFGRLQAMVGLSVELLGLKAAFVSVDSSAWPPANFACIERPAMCDKLLASDLKNGT